MKSMKNLLYIFLAVVLIYACDKPPIGYLDTEFANYNPDSLIVDTANASTDRKENLIPFSSVPMEGFEGTPPINLSITKAVLISSNQSVDLKPFNESTFIRGNGIIDVNFNHTIPIGEYRLGLTVKSEGYTHVLDDIFTLIVK